MDFVMDSTFLAKSKQIAEILESLVTIAAIIVGGVWTYWLFVKKRQKYPHAKTIHEVVHKYLPGKKLWIRVTVTITNLGDVLLSLTSGEVFVQQILPLISSSEESVKLLEKEQKEKDVVCREIEWPGYVREFKWEKERFEIEPGESDQISCDFILDDGVKTIRVYSYLKNVSKGKREIGWRLTTIYNILN